MNKVLKNVFGHEEFRPLQKDIIDAVLDRKKDVLVLMPTGGGKSLTYQLPAVMETTGVTLVISPLRSLIEDQVDALKEKHVSVDKFYGGIGTKIQNRICNHINKNKLRILYTTPETLETNTMLRMALKDRLNRIVIDEVHCVSTWGHDFRESYLKLKNIRKTYPEVQLLCLTATATPSVRKDIKEQLNLNNVIEFETRFLRQNLHINVRQKKSEDWMVREIKKIMKKWEGKSGIIYCTSRKQTERIARKLSVPHYHAGVNTMRRQYTQRKWMKGEYNVIVATVAFGMGVDKENVRFVVNATIPGSIEEYYQEIGRAGRDGLQADCFLFYSYGDIVLHRKLIQLGKERQSTGYVKHKTESLNKMLHYAEEKFSCCHRIICQHFGQGIENCEISCSNCKDSKTYRKKDVTLETKKVFQKIMTGEYSRDNLIHYYKSSIDIIPSLMIFLILHKYIKEDYIPNTQGFLKERLQLFKKAKHVLDGKTKISMYVPEIQVDVKVDPSLLTEKLYDLRRTLSIEHKKPPYSIFNDKTLQELITVQPKDLDTLHGIYGIGPVKLERYGDSIVQLMTGSI